MSFVPLRERLFRRLLAAALRGCGSVADVGCGVESPIRHAGYAGRCIGIDASPYALREASRLGFHAGLVRAQVGDLTTVLKAKSVDAVVALDLIEHLPRERAEHLLDSLEKVARRRVIVLTPNGFVPQQATPENPFQEHLSGFDVDDFTRRGYDVRGLYGLWFLFGELGAVTWRPRVVWRRVADVTSLAVVRAPRAAFSLLCVKEL
jgi:SAM-dependent methyltransferase